MAKRSYARDPVVGHVEVHAPTYHGAIWRSGPEKVSFADPEWECSHEHTWDVEARQCAQKELERQRAEA